VSRERAAKVISSARVTYPTMRFFSLRTASLLLYSMLICNFTLIRKQKDRTMTSFNVKNELRNIGGDIARSGINRLIDTVINSLTNYFRKRSIPKKGTATTSQNASVPPQPPIPNNTNEQSENL